MKKYLFFFFFTLSSLLNAQDTLNQLDENGKKHGKWIVYLTKETWKTVKDSSDAKYYRYTYYDHGVNFYPMGSAGKKNWKLEPSNTSEQNEKIKLLDGEYKWMDEKGRIRFIHIFKKGEYVSYKEFYTSGKLNAYFDYTKKWEEQIHSWYMSVYDKKGNLKYGGYFRKDNGRWPVIR